MYQHSFRRFSCLILLAALSFLASDENIVSADDVPISKLSQNIGHPTLKIFYW